MLKYHRFTTEIIENIMTQTEKETTGSADTKPIVDTDVAQSLKY